jgi:hypothetical protein
MTDKGDSVSPPFRIWTTADPVAMAVKDWVVDGLLCAGEVSGLVAPPMAGKSALALDLAASIAAGNEWFGRKTAPGAALYFAPERSSVTLRRLRAYEIFHEVELPSAGVVGARLDLLNNTHDADRILETIKAHEGSASVPVRLIVVDTARSAMPAGDENSGRDMGRLAQNLGRIRDGAPAAHIQLIHHTPKGRPAEASGHTALAAMLDTIIVVTARGERRSWRVTEANDLPELPPPMFFQMQPVNLGADVAPVVIPALRAPAVAARPAELPADANTALDVLKRLTVNGAAIEYGPWRDAVFEAFGDRTQGAKKQALSAARKVLRQEGIIFEDGNTVSVRTPSG